MTGHPHRPFCICCCHRRTRFERHGLQANPIRSTALDAPTRQGGIIACMTSLVQIAGRLPVERFRADVSARSLG
jgi:hypothetical protein